MGYFVPHVNAKSVNVTGLAPETDDIKKKIDAIWAVKNRPAPKKPQKELFIR